ncbi:MAG: NADH-quinone oxidoreductase subunit N [Nitrospirae bacterium]|nr:NADH-quinone oxidoreductase subunit N [Nitrospirota bacterium]
MVLDNTILLGIRLISPELILICTGLFLLLLDILIKRKETVAFAGLIGIFLSIWVNLKLSSLGLSGNVFSGMFVFDRYGSFFKLIFYITAILTILISLRYLTIQKGGIGEYYALILFATAGMMFMASASDLIVLYLGLELMALSTYILTGILRGQIRSNEAAIKYFLLGAFSSAILLYGISLTYGLTGTTNINEIASSLQALNLLKSPMLFLGLIFFIVAFGFKIALVPFHMWAPDVYEGAPTSITAFMSVGPKAAGFAVFGRVFFEAFGSLHLEWSGILITLSILTMAIGSILAIQQTNLKRMLAYSSISHAGYAILGIISATPEGVSGMMNYLLIYTFMNIGAFAVLIMLNSEGVRGEELSDYEGLAKTHPLASFIMLIFMFSLTGIPPTAGFMAKFYLFMAAIKAGYMPIVIVAVIFSVVSAFFYLRVVMYMYMKEPKGEVALSTSGSLNLALIITAAVTLLIGIFPSVFLEIAKASVGGL